jgi:hypothetical protein
MISDRLGRFFTAAADRLAAQQDLPEYLPPAKVALAERGGRSTAAECVRHRREAGFHRRGEPSSSEELDTTVGVKPAMPLIDLFTRGVER